MKTAYYFSSECTFGRLSIPYPPIALGLVPPAVRESLWAGQKDPLHVLPSRPNTACLREMRTNGRNDPRRRQGMPDNSPRRDAEFVSQSDLRHSVRSYCIYSSRDQDGGEHSVCKPQSNLSNESVLCRFCLADLLRSSNPPEWQLCVWSGLVCVKLVHLMTISIHEHPLAQDSPFFFICQLAKYVKST